jgi:hypothetical protein
MMRFLLCWPVRHRPARRAPDMRTQYFNTD